MNANSRGISSEGELNGGSAPSRMKSLGKGCSRSQSTALLFNTIPPERVGLSGEYDHNGLAKRVLLAFRQTFVPEEIESIRVSQRGAVVVLMGRILNQRLLVRLVTVAMDVQGAADVEVNGVSAGYSLKNYLEVKPSREALLNLLKLINPS